MEKDSSLFQSAAHCSPHVVPSGGLRLISSHLCAFCVSFMMPSSWAIPGLPFFLLLLLRISFLPLPLKQLLLILSYHSHLCWPLVLTTRNSQRNEMMLQFQSITLIRPSGQNIGVQKKGENTCWRSYMDQVIQLAIDTSWKAKNIYIVRVSKEDNCFLS